MNVPRIDHYQGLDGTPAVALALRGQTECLEHGGEQAVGLHWSYNAITATIDGKVVGVIVWIDQMKDSRRIWLQLGYMLPEFRGRGIYSYLWSALILKAQEMKCPQIQSATNVNNYHMREVAKAQGRVEFAVSLRFDVPEVVQS